jgi:MEMO1 family protein
MKVRKPAVAGSFYPGTRAGIQNLIRNIREEEFPNIDTSLAEKYIFGAIVPHAGFEYSGYEAIHVFEILRLSGQEYETVVIINPNHHGLGPSIATDTNDSWKTPVGTVLLDREFIEYMSIPQVEESHRYEHSGEVILPFLQLFLSGNFRIVPVSMLNQDPEQALLLAEKITEAAGRLGRRILVLASSDFSHFVSPEHGAATDRKVIDTILTMDADAVFNVVQKTRASVCGYGPIMTLMFYAHMNFQKSCVNLLKFGNSAKIHPSDSVVDYASLLFYKRGER